MTISEASILINTRRSSMRTLSAHCEEIVALIDACLDDLTVSAPGQTSERPRPRSSASGGVRLVPGGDENNRRRRAP